MSNLQNKQPKLQKKPSFHEYLDMKTSQVKNIF